jgi:hypothetical protein
MNTPVIPLRNPPPHQAVERTRQAGFTPIQFRITSATATSAAVTRSEMRRQIAGPMINSANSNGAGASGFYLIAAPIGAHTM